LEADPPEADALDEEDWLESPVEDDSAELPLETGAGLSLEPAFCSLDSFAPALPDLPDGSLRAQPLPLKCTAGAEMDFLIGPWQLGHSAGPSPSTECMTSTWWPQLLQM
jgi:hypothetical protein